MVDQSAGGRMEGPVFNAWVGGKTRGAAGRGWRVWGGGVEGGLAHCRDVHQLTVECGESILYSRVLHLQLRQLLKDLQLQARHLVRGTRTSHLTLYPQHFVCICIRCVVHSSIRKAMQWMEM